MAERLSGHGSHTVLAGVVVALLILFGWVLGELGPPATAGPAPVAGPCPTATFNIYLTTVNANGGCFIGDKLFRNFAYITGTPFGTVPPATGVTVVPVNGPEFGFTFEFSPSIRADALVPAPSTNFATAIVSYTVQTLSGQPTINGASLAVTGTTSTNASPGSSASAQSGITDTLCLGGTLSGSGPSCSSGPPLVVEVATSPALSKSVHVQFPSAVSQVDVRKQFRVSVQASGIGASASSVITSGLNTVSQVPPTPTPTPTLTPTPTPTPTPNFIATAFAHLTQTAAAYTATPTTAAPTATVTPPAAPTATATLPAAATATATASGPATATPTGVVPSTATATPPTAPTPTTTVTAGSGLGNLRLVAPVRVVDTRSTPFGPIGYQPSGSPISSGQLADGATARFRIAGQTFGGTAIPADATGVLINVTLVQAAPGGGFVTVFPGDVAIPPNASTLNPSTAIAANFWTVALAPPGAPNAGSLAVYSVASPRDILIDLVGYYSPSNPPTVGNLRFITPVRVLDTRAAFGPIGFQPNGSPITAGPITPNQINRYGLAGRTFGLGANAVSFPADVTGILAHVTTVQDAASGGFTTLLPGDATGTPTTSTVNPSTTIAFNSWANGIPLGGPPDTAGTFGVYSTNAQDVLVDVVGYFAPSNPNTVGALNLVTPARVVETRGAPFGPIGFDANGNPISAGQLPDGSTTRYRLNGQSFGALTVPTDAKGALVNVTIVQGASGGGFLTIYPGDAASPPNTSTVNPATAIAASFWASGIPTGATLPGTLAARSVGDPRDLIVDLVGYFR